MKNWKKLISGVVAMMTVATAVSASPAKVPVEVLDVADATGVAYETMVLESVQTAADNGGYWTASTGSSNATPGSVKEEDNGISIRRGTTTKTREVSAGYTTNSTYSYADTKVQFTYRCNTIDAYKGHIIQVSSDILGTTAVSDEVKNAAEGLGYAEYYTDSAVFVVLDGQLKYVDPADGAMKDTGFTIEEDTDYSFRLERTAGAGTYDLYIDTVKIGANSTPVMENLPLMNPTGKNFNQVRAWLGSSEGAEALNYIVYLSDISFMQSASDKPMTEAFVKEDFNERPTSSGNGTWSYWEATRDGSNHGSVTAAGNLALVYSSTKATKRNVNAYYTNGDLASLDEYEVSFDFTANYDSSGVAETIALAGGDSVAVDGAPTGISGYYNSVQIALADGKLYYGCTDESGNSYKEIPGVTYANETKYYAKIAVNNVDKTYSLYLSTSPILLGAEPVVENAGFFCPNDEVSVPVNLGLVVTKTESVAVVGNMTVDNLAFSKESEANIIKKETFDTLPEDGWAHYIPKKNGNPDAGTITASGSLNIAYRTNVTRGGGLYSKYSATELLGEECFEVSYDFIPTLTAGGLWASFALAGNDANQDAVVTGGPTGTETKVPAYYDSIQIAVINDAFAYGCSDSTGNYYKAIPKELVEYESGKKYYLKIKVDAVAGTYTMWLSDSKITSETTPVAENESFFLPSGTAPGSWSVSYNMQRLVSSKVAGSIAVDNLTFKRSVKSSTAFAVMNDDQQYMTTLGTSKYIDLINVPADKKVVVAYYDAEGKLVDVAVATAEALRAKKTDETAVSALVMTWNDFENLVPANAAIELK